MPKKATDGSLSTGQPTPNKSAAAAAPSPNPNNKSKEKWQQKQRPNNQVNKNVAKPNPPPSTASSSARPAANHDRKPVPQASATSTNTGSRQPPSSAILPSVSNPKTGGPPTKTATGKKPMTAAAAAGRAAHKQKLKAQRNAFVDYLATDVAAYLQNCDARMPPAQLFRQLMEVMQRPDEVTWRMLEAVRHDLAHILDTRLPQALESGLCRVHPFGSAISTLSFRDSDFDILIHLPPTAMSDLSAIINGMVRTMRLQQTFYRVVPIIGARVPIIKSVHRGTSTACDFSFCSNFFSVQNTFVVRRLANCNPRIKPLTLLLKFWFRVHGYLGTGKFTSYCLFQLIVFYLQRLPEPVLPPLQHFQRTLPAHLVNGWNVAFDFDRPLPMTRNQDSLMALLAGFFRFYQPFVFEDVVISTLTARTYPRVGFEQATHAGQELYVRARQQQQLAPPCEPLNVSRALCVQDPFTLNINVGTCSNTTFVQFVHHLQSSSVAFDCDAAMQQMSTTLSVANTLLRLYRPQQPVKINKRTLDTFNLQPHDYDLLICARKFAHLPGVVDQNVDGQPNWAVIRSIWNVCVRSFVRSMFVELGGARLVTQIRASKIAKNNRKQKKKQLERQQQQQPQQPKTEQSQATTTTTFDTIPSAEPHRTQTPTKRDAAGEAVLETHESSADKPESANPAKPPASFCQSFDVYLSRNVFPRQIVSDDTVDIQQDRELAQKKLQVTEPLPFALHFELVLWGDDVDDMRVSFQYNAAPKNADVTGQDSAHQTSAAIVAWFRNGHKLYLRKYFNALDRDEVQVQIDSAALSEANAADSALSAAAMPTGDEDDDETAVGNGDEDEVASGESDDDE